MALVNVLIVIKNSTQKGFDEICILYRFTFLGKVCHDVCDMQHLKIIFCLPLSIIYLCNLLFLIA